MAQKDRTKTALDESRRLMLGAQVLLGFQFQAPFQNAFDKLSRIEQQLALIVMAVMVLVVGLLIAPSARHRLVHDGDASAEFDKFVTCISALTLAPFAIALALDVGLAAVGIGGLPLGWAAGGVTAVIALALWYGPVIWQQRSDKMTTSDEKTPLDAKIDYLLTEARVVLPGAQAMLGFQLAIIVTTGFAELQAPLKWLHGAALASTAVATIVLITPAAIHRIVYSGSNEPEFHRIASRLLLVATVFLALGLTLDAYVVAFKITQSEKLALIPGIGSALVLGFLWIIWPSITHFSKRSA